MKKIILFAISFLLLVSCGGDNKKVASESEKKEVREFCGGDNKKVASESEKKEAREFLKQDAVATNNILAGKQIDFVTVCDQVKFVNDEIHYYYTIDESQITMDRIEQNADELIKNARSMFNARDDLKKYISLLEVINGKLIYHYKGNTTGESVAIEVYNFK